MKDLTYKRPGEDIIRRFKDMGDGTYAEVVEVSRQLGQNGGIIIADTNAHSNLNCFAIQALTDTVIAAMTLATGFTGSMATIPVAAGTIVMIGFTAITLTSGKAIVYNN
ncbi:MAG: hypothetical protein ABSA44_09650 [Bacteroidota bacterium]|jgi:hypothetical protein